MTGWNTISEPRRDVFMASCAGFDREQIIELALALCDHADRTTQALGELIFLAGNIDLGRRANFEAIRAVSKGLNLAVRLRDQSETKGAWEAVAAAAQLLQELLAIGNPAVEWPPVLGEILTPAVLEGLGIKIHQRHNAALPQRAARDSD